MKPNEQICDFEHIEAYLDERLDQSASAQFEAHLQIS